MDRRQFCKIASMAMGALGVAHLDALGATRKETIADPIMGRNCRVTVIRRECYHDLQALFLDDPDEGPCRAFASGDDFKFEVGMRCPVGFWPRLWRILCERAEECGSVCNDPLKTDTSILSCPDGTRPVIVRIDLS